MSNVSLERSSSGSLRMMQISLSFSRKKREAAHMPIIIVVNNTKEWPFDIPGVEVVSARAYLTQPQYGDVRNVKVFNLCRSYRYQSVGYYVTLLASARGHKPLPSISTIQDMKSHTMVRFLSDELDELMQEVLGQVRRHEFTLSVYFGHNINPDYDQLSLHLFNVFQAPLLRARFIKNGKWELRSIRPIPLGEIPNEHRNFLVDVALKHFAGRAVSRKKQAARK